VPGVMAGEIWIQEERKPIFRNERICYLRMLDFPSHRLLPQQTHEQI